MKTPMVSIITPVYNSSAYLTECAECVLGQTVTDWEWILIDDGSTDGSGLLCDRLAEQDSRIRVVHGANRGAAAARNTGLDLSRGGWVQFTDSDDLIEPVLLEKLLRAAGERNADTVCCELTVFRDQDGALVERTDSGAPKTFGGREALRRMLRSETVYIYPCNKLIRRSLIGEQRMPEDLRLGEDALFLTELLFRAERVTTIPDALYHVRAHGDSLTRSATSTTMRDAVRSMERVRAFLLENWPEEAALGEFRILYARFTVMDRLMLRGTGPEDALYRETREALTGQIRTILHCPLFTRRRRLSVLLLKYCPPLYRRSVPRKDRTGNRKALPDTTDRNTSLTRERTG